MLFALTGLGLACPTLAQEQTLLSFNRVIDGDGSMLPGQEILIEDGTIVAVGSHLAAKAPQAERIDLSEHTAVPGLIDAHVHITYALSGPPQGEAWTELSQTSAVDRLVAATHKARLTLSTGVTAARDLFASGDVDFQLKGLIDGGVIPGPRLYLSGVGVHSQTLPPLADGEERNLEKDLASMAKNVAETGASWLKIFATTGSADDLTAEQVFAYPELRAATEVAHASGLRVAVHSYGPSAVGDALRAGVDSIEHAVDLSDELLELWSQTDVIYVPTIDHNRYYKDHRHEYGYDEEVGRNLDSYVQRNVEAVRRAHRAGVKIAMGSDAVMTMFGQNTLELEWFVVAGMTPAEALRAATIHGAELLGEQDRLGRLHKGYAADIVALQGNPLQDIKALTRGVRWVMKDGEVVFERSAP